MCCMHLAAGFCPDPLGSTQCSATLAGLRGGVGMEREGLEEKGGRKKVRKEEGVKGGVWINLHCKIMHTLI